MGFLNHFYKTFAYFTMKKTIKEKRLNFRLTFAGGAKRVGNPALGE
jgi:hypothetical protein